MFKIAIVLCSLFASTGCGDPPLSDNGEPCVDSTDCVDGLVCTDYQGGMCLQRCVGGEPTCGENSWCTIAAGPEPGLKCTPPLKP